MGNGHAPGTATGLGAAGAETTVTGFDAERTWEAGLAVFFFAAFLMAGFLAGLFLADATDALRLAPALIALRAADFRETLAAGFFLRATALRAAFCFDVFFFAAFFVALAIRTSGFCVRIILLRRCT